tara:strand:- start:22 stop:558 length:537 start_codon:yes stop_codon:yes gene_type:complete
MPVTKRLEDLPKDLDRKISADFNELLQEIHTDLSTKGVQRKKMPVWTGFFASSWKIQGTAIIPTDKVENYEPWATIKREASLEFFRTGKSSRPKNPEINPRFPIGEEQRIFNYKKPVYIGNKAVYSIYVLESGELQEYIGGLGLKVKQKMTDKNKVRFGQLYTTKGFGSVKPKTIVSY